MKTLAIIFTFFTFATSAQEIHREVILHNLKQQKFEKVMTETDTLYCLSFNSMAYQHIIVRTSLVFTYDELVTFIKYCEAILNKERKKVETVGYSLSKFGGVITLYIRNDFTNISKKTVQQIKEAL